VNRWQRWLGFLFLGLVALLVLLTLLPLFETDEWWVRLWDYPRLQIAGLIVLALIGLAVMGPRKGRVFWGAFAAGVAALAWQLWQVAPYVPGWPVELKSAKSCESGRHVSLLNANVLLANSDHAALLALVRRTNPDVVLLLEPGPEWEEAVRSLYPAFPFRVGEVLPNTYGLILLSKLPLERVQVRYLVQPHVPSVKAGLKLRSGELVDFYGVHPEPPYPADDSGERDAELVRVGKEVRASGRAAIVMGDLNDVAWSHSSRLFRRVAGVRDPRVGRGPYPTFPANLPLLAWPLDHLFVTPHFQLVSIDRLGDIGSDHRPMLFDLCLVSNPGRRLNDRAVPQGVREDVNDELEEGAEERAEEHRG
jgi:endonuclease/exonuclease/phosphatase (EEP) superfamily protein YafD